MSGAEESEVVAGIGSAAVQKATGKGWQEWFAVLDEEGAKEMPHPDIARYLSQQQGLSDWWSQMVTVGYEQARGLRVAHQQGDQFQISRSKTIGASVHQLYEAWTDSARRERWLPGHALTVRRATPDKSMRITWPDGVTGVNVNFYARGPAKSQVTVQHVKLPDASDAEAKKAFWAEALERLKALLEGETAGGS